MPCKNNTFKVWIYFCAVWEGLRRRLGHVCFQSYVCTLHWAPHGIPNISIPVDVFDVFEATQHTLEHDSKHGRGSPSVEQWCTSPLRSVWRVYEPNPPGHSVSRDSFSPCRTDWLHVTQCFAVHNNSISAWKTKWQKLKWETHKEEEWTHELGTCYGTHLTGYLTQQQ